MSDFGVQSYPLSRPSIVKEAREDIPPLYRGRVWAALLKVDPSYRSTYAAIDKESSHSCDRQVTQAKRPNNGTPLPFFVRKQALRFTLLLS